VASDRWITLNKLIDQENYRGIIDLLDDPDVRGQPRLREHVLLALDRTNERAASLALVQAYRADDNPDVRLVAAGLLARRGGAYEAEVEEALIAALADPEARIRVHGARGLICARTEQGIDALVSAVGDENAHVRAMACDSLGSLGRREPRTITVLASALADENRRVRIRSARALAQLKAREALPALCEARDNSSLPMRLLLGKSIRQLE
jgi:HEAT repeat protein